MGGAHSTPMTSTITSNSMMYPSTTISCKITPESYTTSSPAATTSTSSVIPPGTTSLGRPFDHMPSYIPKHWIWSRNLFYPHLSNSSHLLYSNSNGGFSGSDLSSPRGSTKTESLNSNSPAQITEINSDDDSLDSQENEKVKKSRLRYLWPSNDFILTGEFLKAIINFKKKKSVFDRGASKETRKEKKNMSRSPKHY